MKELITAHTISDFFSAVLITTKNADKTKQIFNNDKVKGFTFVYNTKKITSDNQ